MLEGGREQREGGGDFPTGMTVGGGRKQCICQVVLHRLQIVTPYRLISEPSAVPEREAQRKKLIRCEDIQGRQQKSRYRTSSELENSVLEVNHGTNVTTVLSETTVSDGVSRCALCFNLW